MKVLLETDTHHLSHSSRARSSLGQLQAVTWEEVKGWRLSERLAFILPARVNQEMNIGQKKPKVC